jgi:hypothetical protein
MQPNIFVILSQILGDYEFLFEVSEDVEYLYLFYRIF